MKADGKGGNLTPRSPQKNPNRWSPKFAWVTTSVISTTMQNFMQIGLGVSLLRMRDFAPLGTKWLGYFGGVLEKGYSRDARTDFDAKYVKWRGSAQGSAFWGSRNQDLRFRPPFSPKPPFLGLISTGLRIFSPKNGFNIGWLESKRPLIVVVAQ